VNPNPALEMADAYVASLVVNKLTTKESFGTDYYAVDDDNRYTASPLPETSLSSLLATKPPSKDGKFDWFSFVISVFISALAIYLSWTCNSAMGYGTFEKVLYAAGAGLFGTIYLFYYILFRGDACHVAMK
jgi:hypothetical protein